MRKTIERLFASALLVATSQAHALEWGVVLREVSEYTTNSARTSDNEIEEWVHQPGVQLQAEHSGPSYDLSVDYEVFREIYQQDVFDDETVASGTADLVWRALPDRLDFVANHTRTQSTIRSIEVLTPDNRDETITTTAGPILRFNPRGQDTLEFQYEWGDRNSENTEDDAITHEFSTRYGLTSSTTNVVTFEGIRREVQYENESIPDLEYSIGQITWDRTARDVIYALQGGYTQTKRTDLDDVDGFTFDVEVEWQASPSDLVTLGIAREIRDSPISLRTGSLADDLFFPVDSDLGEVFFNNRASISWAKAINARTDLQIVAQYDEEDYEDAQRDTERLGYTVSLQRTLTPSITLSLGLGYDERDFLDEGESTDSFRGNFDLTWQATPRLQLAVGARMEEQDSETSGTGREYDESVGFVRISYALRQLPTPPS